MTERSTAPLSDGAVHLWFLPSAQGARDRLCRDGYSQLSRAERESHRSIANAARARRYLCGRILLRQALAHHLVCDPRALVFSSMENGKLRLDRPDSTGLDFSLSHTACETLLAVARARGLGLDIEPCGRAATVVDIARRFFAPAERRQIAASGDDPGATALSLWTLKEAVVKAVGETIWTGLAGVVLDLSGPAPAWLVRPPRGAAADWLLAHGRWRRTHCFAAALWRPGAGGDAIAWRLHVLGGGEIPPGALQIASVTAA